MSQRRPISLLNKLTLLFSVIILFACAVICVYTYRIEINRQVDECYNANMLLMRSLAQEIDNALAQVEIITQELAYDTDIKDAFQEDDVSRFIVKLMFDAQERVEISESHLSSLNADMVLIRLDDMMPESYGLSVNRSYMAERKDFMAFLADNRISGWSTVEDATSDTLTFFHEVYTSIRQRIGVIMCSISKDRLFRLLQNVEGMMVTNAQDILYTWDGAKHPMPEQLQAGAWFENNAYYIAQPLERLGLTLLICTELQPLRAQALYNALVNMAAISFVGLLLLAVSHIQVRKMLSHLEQTRKAVIDFPEGADLSSRLPDTWNDEAGELAAAFKRLNSRVNEYYHRLLQEEKDKRHAQQIALQYQLNPHFLFNSLYWLQLQLENRDMDDTLSDAIAQLGQVLHYNLEEQLTATLMEEKQMAQAYVGFMSSMKGSEISLDIDLPQSLRCSTVPRFTLQPLLENAIQHGFVKGAPLHLHVSFQTKHGGSALYITVANDGKPIPSDRLAQLNAYLQQPAEDHPAGGVGLRNIKRRLVLFYGETVSMTVASDVQNTQVTITLPASKEQQKETIR